MPHTAEVKVVIRVRPLIGRETSEGWIVNDTSVVEQANPESVFVFDHVFGVDRQAIDIYYKVLHDSIVEQAMCGFNGTVFAYGQTGSGKSFTMLGDEKTDGIIPLAAKGIFSIAQEDPDRDYLVYLSILEIYNEKVRDLLSPEPEQREHNIRQSPSGHVYVENNSKLVVESTSTVMSVVNTVLEERRAVGATAMNERSSRSHCIVRLDIESFVKEATPSGAPPQNRSLVQRRQELRIDDKGYIQNPNSEPGPNLVARLSHLNLVDLAGSERVAKAQSSGQRLTEGSHINTSLLALSQVIRKLAQADRPSNAHISYRDSKLTRILQTALGGNSCTAVICTMSPATDHVEESRDTLGFAKRAKTIKQRVWVNEVGDEKGKLAAVQKEVTDLKKRLVESSWVLCYKGLKYEKLRQQRDVDTQSLKNQINSLRTGNEGLEHEVTALQASLKDWDTDKKERPRLEELAKQIVALQEDKIRLRTDSDEQQELLDELEERHDQDLARIQKLEAELQQKTVGLTKAEKEIAGLETELLEAENTLEERDLRIKELSKRVEAQAQQAETDLRRTEAAEKKLEAENGRLTAASDQMGHQKSMLDQWLRFAQVFLSNEDVLKEVDATEAAAEVRQRGGPHTWPEDSLTTIAVTAMTKAVTFIQSKTWADTPPTVASVGDSDAPVMKVKGLPNGTSGSPRNSPGGAVGAESPASPHEVAALTTRVGELEEQLRQRDAQRDIIIDTKLKRMQDLVIRLHSGSSKLQKVVHELCTENGEMRDILQCGDNKRKKEKNLPPHLRRPPPDPNELIHNATRPPT